jgi:hypothetical protein
MKKCGYIIDKSYSIPKAFPETIKVYEIKLWKDVEL